MNRILAAVFLVVLLALLGGCASIQVVEFQETHRPDPLVLFQFSDLHYRDDRHLKELNALIATVDPDILVFTGDLVSGPGAWKGAFEFLGKVESSASKFAILGNWDGSSGMSRVALKESFARTGFRLLIDEELILPIRDRNIHISGWFEGAWGLHGRSLNEQGADAAVRLIHEPLKVNSFAPLSIPTYIMAGHTHGGQITFFGLPLLLPPGTGRYVAGRYETPAGSLFVSKGLGGSHLDFRLFADPDVIVLRF